MSKYQLEVDLDLGDLGQVRATVDGHVHEGGPFGDGSGYYKTTVGKVIAHIPVFPKSVHSTDLEVTFLICKGTHVMICDELEAMHEAQRRGA